MSERALKAWWDDGMPAGTFVERATRQVEFEQADESRERGVGFVAAE